MTVQTVIHSQEQIERETVLMERCPRFHVCSANYCPLDHLYEQRGPRDEEHQCRARKSTRLRIVAEAAAEGVEMKLPYGGLTHTEHTNEQRSMKAKAHWQALLPEEKRKQLSNLQPYGAKK